MTQPVKDCLFHQRHPLRLLYRAEPSADSAVERRIGMTGKPPPFSAKNLRSCAIGNLLLVNLAICFRCFLNAAFCFFFNTKSARSMFRAALQMVFTTLSGALATIVLRTRGSWQSAKNLNARLTTFELAIDPNGDAFSCNTLYTLMGQDQRTAPRDLQMGHKLPTRLVLICCSSNGVDRV